MTCGPDPLSSGLGSANFRQIELRPQIVPATMEAQRPSKQRSGAPGRGTVPSRGSAAPSTSAQKRPRQQTSAEEEEEHVKSKAARYGKCLNIDSLSDLVMNVNAIEIMEEPAH